jgi:predicted metalloprotease with PDZ domain
MAWFKFSLVVVGIVAVVVIAVFGARAICARIEGLFYKRPGPRPPWETLSPCRITLTIPKDPAARLRVEMTLPSDAPEPLRLYAASGAVGSYEPCDFTPYFLDVAAKDAAGAPLAVVRRADRSYSIAGHPRTIRWEVDAAAGERGILDLNASTHRRPHDTLLSGYATFLVAEGLEDHPQEVKIELPESGGTLWPVETSLGRYPGNVWHARSAVELLDEPIAMGYFSSQHLLGDPSSREPLSCFIQLFTEGDETPYSTLAVLAEAFDDARSAVRALEAPAPKSSYHAFFELWKPARGRKLGWALEHGSSFQAVDETGAFKEKTPRLVYHFLHHMLHAWIPRTLYTDALRPLRQLRGEPTQAIWFAEGFPQYLTFVGMAKAGVAETQVILEMLARRFAVPYTTKAPETRRSMTERSLELCTGRHDEWFFAFSEGALLAMARRAASRAEPRRRRPRRGDARARGEVARV